jgi:hypothetical protein
MVQINSIFSRYVKNFPHPNGCVEWSGVKNRDGYGILSGKRFCSSRLAHRNSFTLHVGPIPDGALVCHKCDNPSCINPDHLFLGTVRDNNVDRANKGRTVSPFKISDFCKRGHRFTEEIIYKKPNGNRLCRICDNDRRQRIRKAKGLTAVSNKLKTHCNKGHLFDEKNTRIEKSGGRRCLECVKIKTQRSKK